MKRVVCVDIPSLWQFLEQFSNGQANRALHKKSHAHLERFYDLFSRKYIFSFYMNFIER